MLQTSRAKEQKQQRINGSENILLKFSTAENIQKYQQKSSGKFGSGVAWNSLYSEFSTIYIFREDT